MHNTLEEGLGEVIDRYYFFTGVGNHSITSVEQRLVLSSIDIANQGEGYNNNKVIVTSSGINTANYTITKPNHLFKDNDEVLYEHTGDAISGHASTITYLVTNTTKRYFFFI